ncbi:hypothetical protein [Pasteurella sp. PK-2025]|uniref:hypothetical protein n=1 Tax=Pasteurella sp. PK-2025 TaxID=3413133 RepID=UPI003C7068A6
MTILKTNAHATTASFSGEKTTLPVVVTLTSTKKSMFKANETVYSFAFCTEDERILFYVDCYASDLGNAENEGVRLFKDCVANAIKKFSNGNNLIFVGDGEDFAIDGWPAFNEAQPLKTEPKWWDGEKRKWVDGEPPVLEKRVRGHDEIAWWLTAENVKGLV